MTNISTKIKIFFFNKFIHFLAKAINLLVFYILWLTLRYAIFELPNVGEAIQSHRESLTYLYLSIDNIKIIVDTTTELMTIELAESANQLELEKENLYPYDDKLTVAEAFYIILASQYVLLTITGKWW